MRILTPFSLLLILEEVESKVNDRLREKAASAAGSKRKYELSERASAHLKGSETWLGCPLSTDSWSGELSAAVEITLRLTTKVAL
jgi:hypothetical protein